MENSEFTGWAKVELMGHNVEIGYVTTRYFGPAALFQVDVPGVEERDETLKRPEYVSRDGQDTWCPAGSVVHREAIPARTSMVGPSTIYRLTPCSEEVAKKALEGRRPRAIAVVSLAEDKRLLPGEVSVTVDTYEPHEDDYEEEDQMEEEDIEF